ncbi:hypothetical protein, partial [Alistipes finegoldii]|uniref:hypothetical protein n=1 Tax=Alistipes finegoldii TaxID=214856 RepID=UPI00242D19F0
CFNYFKDRLARFYGTVVIFEMNFGLTYGRRIPTMKARSRLRGRKFSGRGSPQSVFFARYDPKGGDRAKKPKRA